MRSTLSRGEGGGGGGGATAAKVEEEEPLLQRSLPLLTFKIPLGALWMRSDSLEIRC